MSTIGRYRISYASSSDKSWVAEIRCYDESDSNLIGSIRFFTAGVAVPADAVSNGKPILNYELSRFNDVVTLLRSEDYVALSQFTYETIETYVSAFGLATGGEFTGDLEVK